MNSYRLNVTAKMPAIARAPDRGTAERISVRVPAFQSPPRVVGRYLLCDVFAAGGMATVHLGRLMGPEGFSRTVAIKQLHPQFAHDPKFVAMFLDEARLASRVRHPNVVSPLDVISEPPNLFMVMDYVHGEPLSRLLRRRPSEPVRPRIAAAIVGQILLGLHAAHVATGESGEPLGLVHRDVSPHNILVAEDGVAKVVDFGIAKAKARLQQTERGMLKGKLGYMAPEQLNFEAVDRRADVFAVGVVLWELLTGKRLFSGETPQVVLDKLTQAPILRPSAITPGLSRDLDDVVMGALARSADERFSNARAMAQALDHSVGPASMLELSAWVQSRAGDELAARAERVLDIEALSFDDFTRSARHPSLAAPPPRLQVPYDSVEPAPPVPNVGGAKPRLRKLWLVALLVCAALAAAVIAGAWLLQPPPRPVAGPTVVGMPVPPKTAATATPPDSSAVEPPAPPTLAAPVENPAALRATPKPAASARP